MFGVVHIANAGLVVDIDMDDLSGVEWRDMRRVTGLHQMQIIDGAVNWGDFDCLAALVWTAARAEDPEVTYELVLAAFSYRAAGVEPEEVKADG